MAWSLPTPPIPDSPMLPCLKLRDDLEDLVVPTDVPHHQRFFPKSHVKRLFTDERIREVLECMCSRCQDQKRMFKKRDSKGSAITIGGHRNGPCAILLFALLVYIECPSLIYAFLDKRLGDLEVESKLATFTAPYIQQQYWPKQHSKFADKFHDYKFKFFVPFMRDDGYEAFPEGTILPFINEKRLGRPTEAGEILNEGSFGTVFAFEVLDEYRGFQEFPGVRRFARKQLQPNTPSKRFETEYENLLFVKRLKDDHLVKIVKAYRLGDTYNFIFPCAKTNLGQYLRDPNLRPFGNFRSIVEHPIWIQFLGLARGLHRVLDFEEPKASQSGTHFGYHSDLKPANILVDESESLVITDFGQATFKPVAGITSSKVRGFGGTEAYAPPEIDGHGVVNRRYDIWSLGCVLVEICTYVVRGNQGVLGLDRTRWSKIPGTNYSDDRFFRPVFAAPNSYELKPEIKFWVQELPQFAPNTHSRNFLNEVLLLALRMLDVNVESRLNSKHVCIRFSEILESFRPATRESFESPHGTVQTPSLSGLEVGREIMEGLQLISYNVAGFWKSGPVRFTSDHMMLHIHTLEDRRWSATLLGDTSQLRLVLRHALRDEGSHYASDASLYFLPSEPAQHGKRATAKFSAENFKDTLKLQALFLGQVVRASFLLKTAQLEQKQRKFFPKNFSRRRSGASSQQSSPLEEKASSVQLWIESSSESIADRPGSAPSSRRQSPRSLRPGPPLRRIVVFYERSIVMIRIAKNVRIRQKSDSESVLYLIPTDEKTDPSFPVSLFRATIEERSPSLPLARDVLEFEEEEKNLECSQLALDFKSTTDATSFHHSYKRVKKKWMEEVKAFEALQNQIGPEFGYARS